MSASKITESITFKLTLEHMSDTADETELNDKYFPVLLKIDSQIHIIAFPIELKEKFPPWSLWNLD